MALRTKKPDTLIQQEVLRELKWDTRVDETDVGVTVDDGIVTLVGTVPTYVARVAAQEAAHEVVGVRDVVNDLDVPTAGATTDSDLAKRVRRVLEWHAIPDELITSTISNGTVMLEGEVQNWSQRTVIERAVGRMVGVRGVINRLTVSQPRIDAHEIRESIEEALERRAEREADRIEVSVHDGEVVLTGRVHSWGEKRAMVGAAAHAPGVRKLTDYLKVDPYF
jgi:osmotically-inducible protein OsmY